MVEPALVPASNNGWEVSNVTDSWCATENATRIWIGYFYLPRVRSCPHETAASHWCTCFPGADPAISRAPYLSMMCRRPPEAHLESWRGDFPICGSVGLSLPSCHPMPYYLTHSNSPTGDMGAEFYAWGCAPKSHWSYLPMDLLTPPPPPSPVTCSPGNARHKSTQCLGAERTASSPESCGPSRADDCSSRELVVSGVASPMLPYTLPERGVGPPWPQDFPSHPPRTKYIHLRAAIPPPMRSACCSSRPVAKRAPEPPSRLIRDTDLDHLPVPG